MRVFLRDNLNAISRWKIIAGFLIAILATIREIVIYAVINEVVLIMIFMYFLFMILSFLLIAKNLWKLGKRLHDNTCKDVAVVIVMALATILFAVFTGIFPFLLIILSFSLLSLTFGLLNGILYVEVKNRIFLVATMLLIIGGVFLYANEIWFLAIGVGLITSGVGFLKLREIWGEINITREDLIRIIRDIKHLQKQNVKSVSIMQLSKRTKIPSPILSYILSILIRRKMIKGKISRGRFIFEEELEHLLT